MEDEMDDIQVRDEAEARRLIEAATATIPYGADLLGGVRRRQATRKRRRRIALAAGSGLSAVAVAAGTMLSVAAAGAPSAYAAATAAATRMSATSYHTSQTHRNARGVLLHGAGDFDPA